MNYLKIFAAIILLIPIATAAETNDNTITCKLGNHTFKSTEYATFELPLAELEKDAYMYISSKSKKYTITRYAIGVISKGSNELKGEFIKSGNDIQKALKSEYINVAPGDRIFITELQATCDGCTIPVAIKPMAILVK